MTPEEIIHNIKNQWKEEDETRVKKIKSDMAMAAASQIAILNLSIPDKILKMDIESKRHGFDSIKDVLLFRGIYISPS